MAEVQEDEEQLYTERMLRLAEECLQLSGKERPEQVKLKVMYEEKRIACGLNKGEMDRLLFERIFHCKPESATDVLRIRYWRTGQHYPVNHATALAFARALELTEEETLWMVQSWLDKRDLDGKMLAENPELRRKRCLELQYLAREYLFRKMKTKAFTFNRFRHCYFLDALEYTKPGGVMPQLLKGTIHSINYDSELKRSMKLSGEIPRRTMIRHLILLDMPELSLETIQEQLIFFGYLPLKAQHTLTDGAYCDRIVIEMIRSYERLCTSGSKEKAEKWFRSCYQKLDLFFAQEGKPAYRFLYFKALESY